MLQHTTSQLLLNVTCMLFVQPVYNVFAGGYLLADFCNDIVICAKAVRDRVILQETDIRFSNYEKGKKGGSLA